MLTNTPIKENEEIIKQVVEAGYSSEECNKIIQGYSELQGGKGISSEEIFRSLLGKELVHA